jgi:ketopantoate reductase
LVSLFCSLGLESHLAPHSTADSILYTKLLINCAINPLTALHHIHNGALKEDRFTAQVVGITRECIEVMRAAAIPVADYPPEHDPAADEEAKMWPENISTFMTAIDGAMGVSSSSPTRRSGS